MLSTKISRCMGASLFTHSDSTVPSRDSQIDAVLPELVAAGPCAATPIPAALAEQVLTRIADRDLIEVAIDKAGRRHRRDRALPAWIVVYVVFGLCLFTGEGYASVLRHVWPTLTRMRAREVPVPHASALPKARSRVGATPFATLFDQIKGPAATPDTPGAFQFGLRVVAIDGTTLDVPDSADNDAVFDRYAGSNGAAKQPQVRLTLLIECATHAILAARFDGTQTSEHVMAEAITTDLQPGMLLLADRNYYSFNRWHDAAATGAHLLWRIRAKPGKGTMRLPIHTRLPDGSYLSTLHEPNLARKARSRRTGVGTNLQRRRPDRTVRVIDHTITITTSDGKTRHERYRLLTTILDPAQASAADLAACYHQRWESETGYGHLKTRLRGPRTVLRSRHPERVHQEIWAYLCVYQTLCHLAAAAAHHAGLDPDRISFTVTLREFRRSLTSPTDHPPQHILNRIIEQALPPRRDRISDRGTKPQGRKRRTWTATYKITIQPHPTP
jgi:Insertion element 4 transposase N-terminal/Transposase DDE domain